MTPVEAAGLIQTFGEAVVVHGDPGELRTAVVDGACTFLRGNACLIHASAYYPKVCRGFPFTDAETGGPYEADVTICPEMAKDERG